MWCTTPGIAVAGLWLKQRWPIILQVVAGEPECSDKLICLLHCVGSAHSCICIRLNVIPHQK